MVPFLNWKMADIKVPQWFNERVFGLNGLILSARTDVSDAWGVPFDEASVFWIAIFASSIV